MTAADNIADIYALTPMQRGMLFHALYSPGSGVYVQQQTCILRGALHVAAFRGAWESTVKNHPALRTAFLWEEVDAPVQVVLRTVDLPWDFHDLRNLPLQESQKQLDGMLLKDRGREFDLGAAPLMDFRLVRLAEDTFQFCWSFHHLLVDGWSVAILLDEVFERYNAECAGRVPVLVPSAPFRNFIASLAQRDSTQAQSFWRDRLAGFTTPTPLPLEGASLDAVTGAYEFAEVERLIAEDELDVQQLLRTEQVTFSTLVQGAWALLLSRFSDEEDVVFGSVTAGRDPQLAGSDRMVGLLVNTLPVRVCIDTDKQVKIWLRTIQEQQAAAHAYEQVPLADVLGWSEVPRDTPIFNSLVVVENYPNNFSQLKLADGVVISDVRAFESTHYPLTLAMDGTGPFRCRMLFDRRRFDHATIDRLLVEFEFIFLSLLKGLESPVRALPPLRPEERHQVLIDWNSNAAAFPDITVHGLFDVEAQRTPDITAVIDGGRSLSYADLRHRANQLANWLRARGVRRADRVGLYLDRSVDLMVAVLAILKAGAAYVPLDTAYPPARVTAILNDADVSLVLSHSSLAERLPPLGFPVEHLDQLQDVLAVQEAGRCDIDTTTEDLAYVLYTSGSTGAPKGVAMPHRALCNLIAWQVSRSSRATARTLQFSPISFDVSFQEIFSTWCAGGTLVLVPDDVRRDPIRLLAHIAVQEVERLFLPFVALQSLAQAVDDGAPTNNLRLREVITAGEQLHITLEIVRMFESLPGCGLHNQYGPTETHVVTALDLTGPPASWPRLPSLGSPIANVRAYILNRHMQPVPVGVPGELCIGGVALARGYFNRQDLTAEKFVPDPFTDTPRQASLYRTGDRARWHNDGTLEFLGRADTQIKLRGYRVELGEIEAALLTHPAIRSAAVIAHVGDTSAATRLIAYVVEADSSAATSNTLRTYLAERLPDYMLPSWFVTLPSLPLTPSGKLDRRALPEAERDVVATAAPPRTPTEEVLVQIWSQVLKLPSVGIHDDFFALGGHSLLATQVTARLRQAFAVHLSVRDIFESRTVARLAAAVESTRLAGHGMQMLSLKPVSRDSLLPLSFAQERMWFLDRLDPGSPEYNLPVGLRIRGNLSASAVEASIAAIVARHEILRTTFASNEGQPFQIVHLAQPWPFEVIDADFSGHADGMRHAREFAERPFDLSTGPLGRTFLIRLAPEDHILVLVMHHIVADGWSLGLFVREFTAFYESQNTSIPPKLDVLPLQYADFAWWQRTWLEGDVLTGQLEYWKEQLKDSPRSLSLPTDRRRKIGPPQGASLPMRFGPERSVAIKRLGDEARATSFMTLLAAFQLLLHRITQDEDILVGTPVANRTQIELENLIGCFINPVVLRARFSMPLSFNELLDAVREDSLKAFANQEVPFELVVKSLESHRDLDRNPLFQVMFILQNAPLPALSSQGLTMQPIDLGGGSAAFDLLLTMWEAEGELLGLMEYRSDLFDVTTIQSFLTRFELLLKSVTADPDQLVSKVTLLIDDERQRLLSEWSQGSETTADFTFVHDLLEHRAQLAPDAIAVIDTETHLSYAALVRQANRLAHWLIRNGAGRGARVGLMLERSEALIIAMLAALKAGAAYVPLDPAYPTERLAWMTQDASLKLVLTDSTSKRQPADFDVPLWSLDAIANALECEESVAPRTSLQPEDAAYVLYTSGSTGHPKGVEISHRSLSNFVAWARSAYEMAPTDRVLQFASLSFDTSVEEIYPALTSGATVILRTDQMLGSGTIFLGRIREWGITIVDLPTGYWHLLTKEIVEQRLTLPPTVRLVILGGEAVRPDSLAAWQQHVGAAVRLVNTYGPTEATVVATMAELSGISCEDVLSYGVPIGRPIANVRAYVLDPEMELAPTGSAGELYLGGAGLATGYLNLPEVTAQRFVPSPFDGTILYRTGDKARWRHDGNLEFLGRTDDQFKLRGFRIEPQEIESSLRSHRGIDDAAVILNGDCEADGPRLVAYVVLKNTLPEMPSELRAYLASRLPPHMVPSSFVSIPSLPLTPSNKLDRRALAFIPLTASAPRVYEAPRSNVEREIAALWAEVLKLERVGVNDSFFDLGGHSLLAAQLLARMEAHFHTQLSLRRIFETPTVAGIAAVLEDPVKPHAAKDVAAMLHADSVLDETIKPSASPLIVNVNRIFLTGATGFIGTCLLAELLRASSVVVYCLVRASGHASALERLRHALERQQLWHDFYADRIIPVVGDLASLRFGWNEDAFHQFSSKIDAIYHCGAGVSAIQPYASLRAANVQGTTEVLRLACTGTPKSVHHISTLSIWATPAYAGVAEITETTDPIYCEGLDGGHTQSKWVAERLMLSARERGLPVAIYRPGLVTGDSVSGICKDDDLTLAIAQLCVEFKILPIVDFSLDLIPCDYVARAIVHLSRSPANANRNFHLFNSRPMSWRQFGRWLQHRGYELHPTAIEDLEAMMDRKGGEDIHRSLAPLRVLFARDRTASTQAAGTCVPHPGVDDRNTTGGLEDTSIVCPRVDEALLTVYLDHFIRSGFLKSPEPSAAKDR